MFRIFVLSETMVWVETKTVDETQPKAAERFPNRIFSAGGTFDARDPSPVGSHNVGSRTAPEVDA